MTIIDPEYKDSLIESNAALLMVFIIPFLGIPAVTHLVNRRPYWSVAMPKLRFESWNLFVGLIVATVVGVIVIVLAAAVGVIDLDYVGFDWGEYLPLALIGTVGILIQASTEEMLFRGYLAQFLRRLNKNPIVFILIPAILFSLPHIPNVSKLGGGILVLVPYLINGLLYGWVAFRTGSLWMSAGLHWSNNLGGLVMVGVAGDAVETVAPVQFDVPSLTAGTAIIALQAALTIPALLFLLNRRTSSATTSDSVA